MTGIVDSNPGKVYENIPKPLSNVTLKELNLEYLDNDFILRRFPNARGMFATFDAKMEPIVKAINVYGREKYEGRLITEASCEGGPGHVQTRPFVTIRPGNFGFADDPKEFLQLVDDFSKRDPIKWEVELCFLHPTINHPTYSELTEMHQSMDRLANFVYEAAYKK